VTSDRLHAYQLVLKGLRQHDADVAGGAVDDLQRIDDRIIKRSNALSKQP